MEIKIKLGWSESESCSIVSASLRPGLYSPWNSLGQITGVGSLFLLQGISPTQGSNPGLLHCRQRLYQLNHKGRPRILEWVDYPFSSGPSQPINLIEVSCITGGFFTNWAIRETQRISRREKKAFLSEQCKETEENNRMGNTRDLFKKIRDIKWKSMQHWTP